MNKKIIDTIIQRLQNKYTTLDSMIKETTTDSYQIRCNLQSEWLHDRLNGMLELILSHVEYINRDVYKYENNFRYTMYPTDGDMWNKPSITPTLFTEELCVEFLKNYITFTVEHEMKHLFETDSSSFSTCPISNLKTIYKIEGQKDLIKLCNKLLKNKELWDAQN